MAIVVAIVMPVMVVPVVMAAPVDRGHVRGRVSDRALGNTQRRSRGRRGGEANHKQARDREEQRLHRDSPSLKRLLKRDTPLH